MLRHALTAIEMLALMLTILYKIEISKYKNIRKITWTLKQKV